MDKITIKEFARRHPEGVYSITNRDYTRVANGVLGLLRKCEYWDEYGEGAWMDVAIKLTLYFEDVVSEVGLWRSFVEKHTELYGKPLPFFDIEGEYDPDRLHVEDIQLLIWDCIISDERETKIPIPVSPYIADAAKSVYYYLEGLFEDTPINDSLYDFFHEAKFADSYYDVREVLTWYFTYCYLTAGRFRLGVLDEETQAVADLMNQLDDEDSLWGPMTIWCNLATNYPIGPLALLPKDWLAALMRIHGQDDIAADIEAIDARPSCPYLLEEYDKHFVILRSPDDELLRVARMFFSDASDSTLSNPNTTGCLGSFANYRGDWLINGMSGWGNYAKAVEKEKEREREMAKYALPNYDKYAAKAANKGDDGLMLFFKTPEECNRFLKKELKTTFKDAPLPNGDEGVVLFAPKRDGGFYLMQGNAPFIKSPDNPMYDPEKARVAGLFIADVEGLSSGCCRYLINHNLIPDVGLKTTDGYELGCYLLQDNLDFMARTFRRHYY